MSPCSSDHIISDLIGVRRVVSEGSITTSLLIVRTRRIFTPSCNKTQDEVPRDTTEFPAYSQILPRKFRGEDSDLRNYNFSAAS